MSLWHEIWKDVCIILAFVFWGTIMVLGITLSIIFLGIKILGV
jgi:hypothetical protein